MHATALASDGIRLWAPDAVPAESPLEGAIVDCLSSAFSSGVWARAPMPVGERSDSHSARGIVAQLGADAQVLVAFTDDDKPSHEADVHGCVVGGLLDEDLIRAYGLGSFGARRGDGILAYIGVQPSAQGNRLVARTETRFGVAPPSERPWMKPSGASLAGLLFSGWLRLPAVARCPRVFVRTRSVLPKIQYLAEKNGFVYQGRFELEFKGEQQDRMVYTRLNDQSAALPLVA